MICDGFYLFFNFICPVSSVLTDIIIYNIFALKNHILLKNILLDFWTLSPVVTLAVNSEFRLYLSNKKQKH